MFLVDSHCHLDYEPMSLDITKTLEQAKQVGVKGFLTIGTKLTNFLTVAQIAENNENVFASVGVHPHEADTISKEHDLVALLKKAAESPKVVAFGETGLDYYYENSPVDIQKMAFREHIQAAVECDLPLIVHTRDAEVDTISLLKEQSQARGVLHCFSGSPWLRDQALELGFYISVSGIVTFKKAEDLRNTIKDVPLDRLLLETDSPFLAPEPYRGKPNEPSYMVKTAERLAALKDVAFDDICKQTTQNFLTLFNKAKFSCA